jgi:hypothetical protein
MGCYNAHLEWESDWPAWGRDRRGNRLQTRAYTQRGNGDQPVVVTFSVDQVLDMIQQDPDACERLLHHADLVRGAAALAKQEEEAVA